jgi:tetratricopeptide (TPR) repeat protein
MICLGLAFSLIALAGPAGPGEDAVGSVSFPNSGAAAAQPDFLRGMAQLHNFEYEDSAGAFRRAEQIDPGFAMAYWGEAMTKNHPIWMQQDRQAALAILERLAATAQARLAKAPTAREKAYLRALDILYGEGEKPERDRRYCEAMRELAERFPEDPDAAAFYALSLLGTAHGGRDIPVYMKTAGILEPLFCRYPQHPGIAHYLIHSCDDPAHAPLALAAARAYSQIAPGAGHAQHMCSHIFLALGMWDDVVRANEKAIAVVDRGRREKGMPDAACGHYPLWLEYGYLQQGRVREADRILSACRAQWGATASDPKIARHLDPDRSPAGSWAQMWAFRALDGRGSAPAGPAGDAGLAKFPSALLTFEFARGIEAAGRGDLGQARAASSGFDAARKEMDPELRQEGIAMDATRVEILRLELDAAIARAEARGEDAVSLARKAALLEEALPVPFGPPFVEKPADELLGEILLGAARSEDAVKAYEASLARAPRRAASLLGLARAASAAGQKEKARRAYGELQRIWEGADQIPAEVVRGASGA